jgi:putative methyltransferase (TIGR04325 family)
VAPWLKNVARELLPPFAVRLLLPPSRSYDGVYPSWAAAAARAVPPEVAAVDRVKDPALRVKRGEAVYERDGWVFSHVQYAWPVLAGLLAAACAEGRLSVLDFGGSLGTTYRQNSRFLTAIPHVEWSIVDLPDLVACGREHFEDNVLRFYDTVAECLAQRRPNVILLSGVLQYLPDPKIITMQLLQAPAAWCIIDRTPITTGSSVISLQVVARRFGGGRFPARIATREDCLALFPGFAVEAEFDSVCDPARPYRVMGFLLRRSMSAPPRSRRERA